MRWIASTVNARRTFAAASMLLAVATMGCSIPRTTAATATEAELCRGWALSLPSRSRRDTVQTRIEIGAAYDAFRAACSSSELPARLAPSPSPALPLRPLPILSGKTGPSAGVTP